MAQKLKSAVRSALLLLGACLLSACASQSLFEGPSDLQLTWERAMVALPPSAPDKKPIVTRMRDLEHVAPSFDPGKAPVPTVIYMHGCTGLGSGDAAFLRHLARHGYAVIAPDSMARRYRPWQCDPKTKTGGHNTFVYDFRQAEISYALDRLPTVSWVDRRNLFLAGASEGGVAAALYRGGEFRARIIAQWTCHGGPLIRGLSAPDDEPVLSIVRKKDPWYDADHTVNQQGDCGAYFGTRPDSRSVVLPNGHVHDVLRDEQALREIYAFLDTVRAETP
jgi:poly(3-hydroxybutyrate) depolymerase